jgi:hypothetical protein
MDPPYRQIEPSYNNGFKRDKNFLAKILGLVDLTFFQFCDSCLRATIPDEVDFGVISLHSKRYNIIQNCFQANKPSYLIPSKPIQEDSNDDGKGKIRKKKLKLDKDNKKTLRELGSVVHNPNVIKEWAVSKNTSLYSTRE